MADKKVIFSLGIGFANANREETFTLDQLGITEDDYDTQEELDSILEEELKNWTYEHIDSGFEMEE